MKYLIANHKSLMTHDEIKEFKNNYKYINNERLKTIICPSNPYLTLFNKNLGVQNISHLKETPFTGEIDVSQLKGLNVEYAIVGHSERRTYLNEDNDLIIEKLKLLDEYNVTPILCVGETLEEYKENKQKEVLRSQLDGVVNNIKDNIIIAYEPVWAIGSGLVPTNEEIYEITKYIKELVKDITNKSAHVLYGGSVNPNNIQTLEQLDNVDGYLVGGASNDYTKFNTLVDVISEVKDDTV